MNVIHRLFLRIAGLLSPLFPHQAAQICLAIESGALPFLRRGGEPELALLRYLVDPDRASIDAGANWGGYTGLMLKYCDHVIAIEANPTQSEQLRRNWPDADVRAFALGECRGALELLIPRGTDGRQYTGHASLAGEQVLQGFASYDRVTVDVYPLDELDLPPIGFIKIDVEGFEIPVINGARNLISRDRPHLLIESQSSHAAGCPHALVAILEAIGYSPFYFDEGQLLPFSSWSPDKISWHGFPVNNFIFIHNDRGGLTEVFPAGLVGP